MRSSRLLRIMCQERKEKAAAGARAALLLDPGQTNERTRGAVSDKPEKKMTRITRRRENFSVLCVCAAAPPP